MIHFQKDDAALRESRTEDFQTLFWTKKLSCIFST